ITPPSMSRRTTSLPASLPKKGSSDPSASQRSARGWEIEPARETDSASKPAAVVSAFPQIDNRDGEAFDLVVSQRDLAGAGAEADADAGQRLARLPQMVAGKEDPLGLPLHVDTDAIVRAAVADAVVLHPIAVRRESLAALGPKQDPYLAAAED